MLIDANGSWSPSAQESWTWDFQKCNLTRSSKNINQACYLFIITINVYNYFCISEYKFIHLWIPSLFLSAFTTFANINLIQNCPYAQIHNLFPIYMVSLFQCYLSTLFLFLFQEQRHLFDNLYKGQTAKLHVVLSNSFLHRNMLFF